MQVVSARCTTEPCGYIKAREIISEPDPHISAARYNEYIYTAIFYTAGDHHYQTLQQVPHTDLCPYPHPPQVKG